MNLFDTVHAAMIEIEERLLESGRYAAGIRVTGVCTLLQMTSLCIALDQLDPEAERQGRLKERWARLEEELGAAALALGDEAPRSPAPAEVLQLPRIRTEPEA
jgi:hypothetical protein